MKSAVERIFLIEQPHFENIKQSENYWALFEKLCVLIEKLGNEITAEQKQMLTQISNIEDELCGEVELTAYKAGFKFGLQLGAETYTE